MTDGETSIRSEELRAPGRVFLPSLALSYSVVILPTLIIGVLLLDIGLTFKQSAGVTGQLQTAASLVAMLTALLMGAWSVRFNHKSLLLMGILVTSLAAVGCFLALNFPMLLIFFALSGMGLAMVEPMVFALVGEHISLAQRARAISWLITGSVLAIIIGTSVVGFIGGGGGKDSWRWTFFGVLLPLTLLSLGLTMKKVPYTAQSLLLKSSGTYWEGFMEIYTNRSAMVCLVGNMLLIAGWQAVLVYYVTFLRERFPVSIEVASILFAIGGGLFYTLGSQIGGLTVTRFGRKRVTVVTAFFMGIFIIAFMTPPNLWLAVGLSYLASLFSGMRATASISLTLEQVPRFRGSMMSLNSAITALGGALGASVGGLILLRWDFEGVGLTLGALCLVAALIYYLLAVDPTLTDLN